MDSFIDGHGMIIKDILDARILVEIGAQLSFSRAARTLGVPAATLSRRIAEMERLGGLRLFERTTRAVTVTDAGEIVLAHAGRILAEIDEIGRSLEERRNSPVGQIRVSAPNILGQHTLGPILAQFLTQYPGCDVVLDLSNRRVDLVEERFDFVIRVGKLSNTDFVARPLGDVSAGLYQRRGATQDKGRAFRVPADLENCDAGLLRSDEVRRSVLRLTHEQADDQDCAVHARLIALNPWLLADAALGSDLVVVLPRFVGDELVASGGLEAVLEGWSAVVAPVNILYPSKRHLRPATRALIDFITERLPREMHI